MAFLNDNFRSVLYKFLSKRNVLYIHGANMSPVSFSVIQKGLGRHKALAPSYSIAVPLQNNIKTIARLVRKEFGCKEFDIVSHSLGGIIALLLLRTKLNVSKIVTISTPFGGSEAAAYLRYMFPSCQLYKDISPSSEKIKEAMDIKLTVPVLAIVTTGGESKVPFMTDKNDTVVTVSSQTASENLEYYYVDLNHFEVLMSDEVANKVKSFLYSQHRLPTRPRRKRGQA